MPFGTQRGRVLSTKDVALCSLILIPPVDFSAPSLPTVGLDSVALPPGLTSLGLHFSSTHSLLAALKKSGRQWLLLPFLALFPSPLPCATITFTLTCLHTLTPPSSFRDPNVLGNGISWSHLVIIGHFMPSPTHTLSLHPALVRSLEKKQKWPCSLHCPFPSLLLPLSSPLRSQHYPPLSLSFEQGRRC